MSETYHTLRRINEPVYGHIQETEIFTSSIPHLYPTTATLDDLRQYFHNEPTILRQLEDYQFVVVHLTEAEPAGFEDAIVLP